MLVEMHDHTAMMQQDHEHVEHAEGRSRHNKEVDGDEVRAMSRSLLKLSSGSLI